MQKQQDEDAPKTVMIDDFDFFYEEEKREQQKYQRFKVEDPSKLMIEEMLEDSKYFFVKGKSHEFIGNKDPIF